MANPNRNSNAPIRAIENRKIANAPRSGRGSKSEISWFKAVLYAIALIILSEGFWSFLAAATPVSLETTNSALIIKAIILSLGLVAFIVKWESGIIIISRFWVLILPILLAYVSSIWSISPFDTVRGSIMLLLLVFFSLAISLDLEYKLLLFSCVIAQICIVLLDFGTRFLHPDYLVDGANIGFLLALLVCTIIASRKWRILFIVLAIITIGLAIMVPTTPVLAASSGLIVAFAAGAINKARLSKAQKSTLMLCLALLVSIVILALFGPYFSNALSDLFEHLGARAILGTGFETAGQTIGAQFGLGLGVLGVCIGMTWLFGSIATAYYLGRVSFSLSLLIFAIAALLLISPDKIDYIDPICIVFLAAIFKSIIAKIKLDSRRNHLGFKGNRRP